MEPWLLAVLLLSAGFLLAALLLSLRRQRQFKLAESVDDSSDLPGGAALAEIPLRRVANPTGKDLEAYACIERHRRRVWLQFRLKTRFSLPALGELGMNVIRDVAQIYHPDADRPEMRASVRDLLTLNHRVTLRLLSLLDRWPVKAIGTVRIDQALWVREKVKEIQEGTIGTIFRHSTLGYNTAKWAWRAWNVANPLYWGRQAIYTGGREAALRYLLTSLVTYVGEEAVLTYSGRHKNEGEEEGEGGQEPSSPDSD